MTGISNKVFRMTDPCFAISAVGNHAVSAGVLSYLEAREEITAWVYPPQSRNNDILSIWNSLFPGRVSKSPSGDVVEWNPGRQTKLHAANSSTILEAACREFGYELSVGERIQLPVLWRSRLDSRRAMIYPLEITDNNDYFDTQYWITAVHELKSAGYKINLFGKGHNHRDRNHHGSAMMSALEATGLVDRSYSPTIDALKACIAECSLAIGASTGPSWLCLFSDIEQVALDRPRVLDTAWAFESNSRLLEKRIHVVKNKASVISRQQGLHGDPGLEPR